MDEEKRKEIEGQGETLPARSHGGDPPLQGADAPRWLTVSSEEPKDSPKGDRLLRGVLFLSLFLSLLCLLLAFLAWRRESPAVEAPSEETETPSVSEKVVFVRDDGVEEGRLSLPEVYHRCAPSAVTLFSEEDGSWAASGFVVRSDGYIATAYSALDGREKICVRLAGGEEYAAYTVASDTLCDLALLKIEGEGLEAVTASESGLFLAGERLLAIGVAGDSTLGGSALTLRISHPLRELALRDEEGRLLGRQRLLQLDVSVDGSMAGAPLFDEYGGLAGMVSGRRGEVGFALQGSSLLPFLCAMIEGRETTEEERAALAVAAPRMGILGERACEEGMYGVRIVGFADGPLSASEMLKEGDLILRIDREPVTGWEEMAALLEERSVGDRVLVTVWRRGQTLSFEVELAS